MLTPEQLTYIKSKRQIVLLNFSFKVKSHRSDIRFHISSKITDIVEYIHDKKGLYFCFVNFLKKAPDDYINILGTHIYNQLNLHKRAEERFLLNKECFIATNNKSQENFIFISGNCKRCILTEISIFSAKVILVSNLKELTPESNAMLIMKYKDLKGTGEMIGNIERVEVINKVENLYSIIIKFDQEAMPPVYKLWIAEYLEYLK